MVDKSLKIVLIYRYRPLCFSSILFVVAAWRSKVTCPTEFAIVWTLLNAIVP